MSATPGLTDGSPDPRRPQELTRDLPERQTVVFLGTPEFAVPSLRALVADGHDVALVVTVPSRRAGRGQRETLPPVARAALDLGIRLFQPERVRSQDSLARISEARPSALVVAAYGQILPPSLLAIPSMGCVNVHPSLLPRHRGASPISGAILAGDAVTGVTIMLMDEGMDTGPILTQMEMTIDDSDDQISLTAKLADSGADLLVETLRRWANGALRPIPQDPALATLTRPTRREDGDLDWNQPARELWLRVRAFADWPQGYTTWNGSLLRIKSATYDPAQLGEPGLVRAWGSPGRNVRAAAIGTGAGALLPTWLQLPGGKPTPVEAFLRGHPSFIGTRLQSSGVSEGRHVNPDGSVDRY